MQDNDDNVQLRFEGYSDDTFGEYQHTNDDYDNCASGKPIEWLVQAPNGESLIVFGQYAPGSVGGWMIGVGTHDPDHNDDPLPPWPIRLTRGERPYSPALHITAPAGTTIRCLQREGDDA